MSKLFARFLQDESGATAIEYGLIAAGIALAIIAVVNGLGLYEGAAVKGYFGGLAILIAPGYGFRRAVKSRSREAVRRRRRT
jgi:pilus assembly protein Flp/PilA